MRKEQGPIPVGRPSDSLENCFIPGVNRLSPRKKEVLDLVLKGKTNPQIAEALVVTESDVKNHFWQICRKLGVKNGRAGFLGKEVDIVYPAEWEEAGLTSREGEALNLAIAGLSNKEIAERLEISEKTVKRYLHHVFGKLHLKSRWEAAAKAGSRD